jgi:hypothetical protein
MQSRIRCYPEAAPAGRYEANGNPNVAWDTNEYSVPSCLAIALTVDAEAGHDQLYRARAMDTQWNEAFNRDMWISPLPDTPFWELDTVAFVSQVTSVKGQFTVQSIDYSDRDCLRADEPSAPTYQLIQKGKPATSIETTASELILITRGNFYLYEHDPARVSFVSFSDECEFHRFTGRARQVRDPYTKFMTWSMATLTIAAIRGDIDYQVGMAAYKFLDPDLSARANTRLVNYLQSRPRV